MSFSMKLILIASFLLLVLIALSEATVLRVAYGLFMVLIGASLLSNQEVLRQQVKGYRQEFERANRICEELDQNTKIIVQTDLELTKTQEALDKKVEGLYALQQLSEKIISTTSINELCRLVADATVRLLGYEKAIFCIVDPEDTTKPFVVTQSGFQTEEAKQLRMDHLLSMIHERALISGKNLFIQQLQPQSITSLRTIPEKMDPEIAQNILHVLAVRSAAIVPLFLEGQPNGFLFAGTNPPFANMDQGDMELMSILNSEAGVAIDNLKLYEALKQSHAELEERVIERTKELAEANEKLVKLDKMKSDFVSAVSHELRTPLTSIKGFASLVRDEKLGPVNEKQAERLGKIDKHADYLTNLISELLDIARIESGRVGMTIKESDMQSIAEAVGDILMPQIKERDLNMVIDIPKDFKPVQVDETRIQRCFINLLSNAIRFTPHGGTLTIRATPGDEFYQVDVVDTGIGMPEEDVQNLFTEFFRADNEVNRDKKGTGLGLVLVKKIIEAHGGRIWVSSEVGVGTTFSFSLPWDPPEKEVFGVA